MKWCVIFLAACTAVPPPLATQADAVRANIELAQLNDGRDLLLRRCGACHDVPTPGQKPAAEWPKQVALMQKKANIDDSQRTLITQYLVTLAPK